MKNVIFSILSFLSLPVFGQGGRVINYQRISFQKAGLKVSPDTMEQFSKSSCHLGDIDKDGKQEIFVTGWDFQTLLGLGYLLSLNSDGTVFKTKLIGRNHGLANNATPTWYSYGWSCANIGDLDKDGVTDLAIGNPGQSGYAGDFFIVFLKSDGSVKNYKQIAEGKNGFNTTLGTKDRFGNSIINAGDINSDGITEFIVGAPYTSDGALEAGAIWILSINDTGYCTKYQKISHTNGGSNLGINSTSNRFGSAICAYRDINDDSIADFFVSSAFAKINGQLKGRIYGISLNRKLELKSYRIISDTSTNFGDTLLTPSYLGLSIGNIGDLDGNGYNEVALGSPVTGSDYPHGHTRLLYMNKNWIIDSSVAWDSSLNGCPPITYQSLFGSGISGIGDINGDGKLDAFVGSPGDSKDNPGYGAGYVFFLDGKVHSNASKLILKSPLKMYPNPSKLGSDISVEIPITMADEEVKCNIINSLGQVVFEKQIEKNTLLYTLENVLLAPGLYNIVLRNNTEIYSNKIIIE